MRSSRLLTALCYMAMMSLAIGLNLLPVFLTSFRNAFPAHGLLNQEELGRLGAITFGGLCIGIVLTGPMADRWGTKPFVLVGLALTAISLAGMSLAPTYFLLCAIVFVLGFGAGGLDMVLSPIVAALNPERRASALNWLHSYYCIGAVVTILAGTLALQLGLGWRLTCVLVALPPLALLVAFAATAFPSIVPENGRTRLRTFVHEKWFIGAMIAIALGGATEMGMSQWLPAYAETSLLFPQWVGGTGLLLFSMAMALGRIVVGAWGTKYNPYNIMAWGCAGSVVFFLLGAYFPGREIALAACVLAGFTGSCLWPTMLAVSADRYPNGGASMFAALAALGNAGGIFMPWIVGWIADRCGLPHGLAVSALAPILMLPLVLALKGSAHKQRAVE